MTCPACSTRAAELDAARRRIAELEAGAESLRADRRRLRERVAVLMGRVAVVADVLEEHAVREANGG